MDYGAKYWLAAKLSGLTVLYLALTVLHLALTVLYLALPVLYLALPVLYVPSRRGVVRGLRRQILACGKAPDRFYQARLLIGERRQLSNNRRQLIC